MPLACSRDILPRITTCTYAHPTLLPIAALCALGLQLCFLLLRAERFAHFATSIENTRMHSAAASSVVLSVQRDEQHTASLTQDIMSLALAVLGA